MKGLYCDYNSDQTKQYIKKLHSLVHWLLVYKDTDEATLGSYFSVVQYKIAGLNSLLLNPPELVELMGLIESARLEYLKQDECDSKLFRRTVLDAHALIDKIDDRLKEEANS